MPHPVELFFQALRSTPHPSVRWIGESWSSEAVPALRAQGWTIQVQDPGGRLEFLSLPRESLDGVLVEALPAGWPAELVQRLLASVFQGLRPGGFFFVGFEARDSTAVLAWLRQAGFEALQQGSSAGLSGVLARRIGARAP